ncbi:MAG: hypothetical protein IPM29_21510 [Planctomycetes bacterium]|nr:hypothetical protein [Planctomycetota bacterium]
MSTSVYWSLYHLTFVAHAFCASFVLAATLWLTAHGVLGLLRRAREGLDPVGDVLRDRLPFVLGLAITFGVGPLLFVQVLDGHAFYTAALLLSHRFMAILPALIVGFYLLYVQKTRWRIATGRAGRLLVPAVATACFAYTGWSWAELRLLALAPERWAAIYAAGPLAVHDPDAPLRLLVMLGVGLQVSALLLLAALRGAEHASTRRHVAMVQSASYLTLVAAQWLHSPVRAGGDGWLPGCKLALAIACAVHAALWLPVWAGRPPGRIAPIGTAVVAQIALLSVIRSRPGSGPGSPAAATPEAATSQGFVAFAVAFVGVVVAIAVALRMVRRDLARR